tara:strand:- start:62893 stop:65535 length:2643 start_codon:yes stop_codon:yes gene_type:complete
MVVRSKNHQHRRAILRNSFLAAKLRTRSRSPSVTKTHETQAMDAMSTARADIAEKHNINDLLLKAARKEELTSAEIELLREKASKTEKIFLQSQVGLDLTSTQTIGLEGSKPPTAAKRSLPPGPSRPPSRKPQPPPGGASTPPKRPPRMRTTDDGKILRRASEGGAAKRRAEADTIVSAIKARGTAVPPPTLVTPSSPPRRPPPPPPSTSATSVGLDASPNVQIQSAPKNKTPIEQACDHLGLKGGAFHVFKEMVTTENSYVAKLDFIDDRAISAIEAAYDKLSDKKLKGFTSKAEFQEIIEILKDLRTAQKALTEALNSTTPSFEYIGQKLEALEEKYSSYTKAAGGKEYPVKVNSALSKSGLNSLTLDAILMEPIQRGMRYKLLTEELIKQSKKTTEIDKVKVKNAPQELVSNGMHSLLNTAKKVADGVNEQKRLHDVSVAKSKLKDELKKFESGKQNQDDIQSLLENICSKDYEVLETEDIQEKISNLKLSGPEALQALQAQMTVMQKANIPVEEDMLYQLENIKNNTVQIEGWESQILSEEQKETPDQNIITQAKKDIAEAQAAIASLERNHSERTAEYSKNIALIESLTQKAIKVSNEGILELLNNEISRLETKGKDDKVDVLRAIRSMCEVQAKDGGQINYAQAVGMAQVAYETSKKAEKFNGVLNLETRSRIRSGKSRYGEMVEKIEALDGTKAAQEAQEAAQQKITDLAEKIKSGETLSSADNEWLKDNLSASGKIFFTALAKTTASSIPTPMPNVGVQQQRVRASTSGLSSLLEQAKREQTTPTPRRRDTAPPTPPPRTVSANRTPPPLPTSPKPQRKLLGVAPQSKGVSSQKAPLTYAKEKWVASDKKDNRAPREEQEAKIGAHRRPGKN